MGTQLTTQLSLVTSGRATYLPATLHHLFSHCLFIGRKDDLLISPTHHHQVLCAGGGEQGGPAASTPSCTHLSSASLSRGSGKPDRTLQIRILRLTLQARLHCHPSQAESTDLFGVHPASLLATPACRAQESAFHSPDDSDAT